jgi:septum formation protein
MNILHNKGQLILGSKSPRRRYLLEQAGFDFTVMAKDVKEVYPPDLPVREVPGYLAKLKAAAILPDAPEGAVVIASDTIVLLNNTIYGKPVDRNDAIRILKELSGNLHEVITGVCLLSTQKVRVFSETTKVFFDALTDWEIEWYIDHYEVMDKAGAYGIQDGIGLIGIKRIEGCYFNVMGLPVHRLYKELQEF